LAPDEIAVEQAEKRVSAGTMGKMIKKVLSKVPGLGNPDAGVFFYPRKGFGQIANAMADAVEKEGGRVLRSMPVKQVLLSEGRIRAVVTPPEGPGMPDQEWGVDHVFSTIPITRLVSMLSPDVPDAVLEAAGNLRYRGMVFMYLELNTAQFTPYDAHYFPGKEVVFSRMSEPKNYYVGTTPKDRTGLCLEIPCAVGDDIWTASDEALGDRVMEDLAHVGLNVRPHVARMFSRRHANVYPMYDLDFAPRLQAVEDYLATVDGLVTLGRQGLFAHDNTHHTMEMACRASDCLGDDLTWDQTAWAEHREVFRKHVVVD
jgi:protoporphyrinogen oxidase